MTPCSLKCISDIHLPNLLCHSGDGRLGGNESCASVVLEVTWRVVEAKAWFGGWPYVSLERQTALPFLQHFDRQVGVQHISSQTKAVSSTSCFEVFPKSWVAAILSFGALRQELQVWLVSYCCWQLLAQFVQIGWHGISDKQNEHNPRGHFSPSVYEKRNILP